MPAKVKCTVTNCRYYNKEDCQATAIEINVDGGGATAVNEAATMCHTFEHRY